MLVYQRLCGISDLAMLDDTVAGMQYYAIESISEVEEILGRRSVQDRPRTDPAGQASVLKTPGKKEWWDFSMFQRTG